MDKIERQERKKTVSIEENDFLSHNSCLRRKIVLSTVPLGPRTGGCQNRTNSSDWNPKKKNWGNHAFF